MCRKHLNYLLKLKSEKISVLEMRSHISWYIKGLPKSTEIKKELFTISDAKGIMNLLDRYQNILDNEEELKIESDKEKEYEKIETKSEEEDINLDDLENILDEEDTKIPEETENYKEPEKTEDKITKDETKEEIDDLPDLDHQTLLSHNISVPRYYL